MSTNSPTAASSKNINPPAQVPATSLTQAVFSAGGDPHGRRSGASGSYGVGSTSRAVPTARNNQGQKKQNKGSRKFRLADEDAFAESVSNVVPDSGRRDGIVV